MEGWAIRKGNIRFRAEVQVDVLRNAQGDPTQIIFMVRDVSEQKRAQDELRLAASVFTYAREGIMITDTEGRIVAVNETFSHITGYLRREVLGKSPEILHSGRQGPEFYETMWKSIANDGHWSGEVWNRRKNGEVYAEMLTISVVLDEEHKPQNYVSLFTDITPMKEYQNQLERIAHYDALTNLPNRVLFADRLRQAVVHSQRRKRLLSVVYLDLDGFKAVNDAHGHAVGDELLIVLARRMKVALRDGDSLARVGGDEFVAVLVDLDTPADCEPVLKRLLGAASGVVTVGTATGPINLQVSASIGATIYPQDGSDADLLMRHADQAMYLAKQGGKNRFHLFDTDRDTAVKIQRESVERIRRALEGDELVLYYQPKVNMQTREVVGAEALIRWQHPERGLLAPAEFLPIIENHPLSVAVGEWVINTALTQIVVWKALGLDLPVSVNMGAYQLQQPNFVENLKASLARHPLVPRFGLELEILETSAIEDLAQVSGILHACRAEGVLFAVDDFGTGYSSLTYLKHLPAETLKIDQSFVRGMLSDPDDMAIVNDVIGLAGAFGRGVIAEGVETDAHGEKLIAMGCPVAQGYGIARPMPAEHMAQWTRHWKNATTV
jgi:diguanylate cyclase (GGDEF)-like protein/PAS domain S-box-containing protein